MVTTNVNMKRCYFIECPNPPTWSVRTQTSVMPNGQPFNLYTCDEHCQELTNDCRKAGARYLLRPLYHKEPETHQETVDDLKYRWENGLFSLPMKILFAALLIVAGITLALPMLGYYLIKWKVFGWKPPKETP
jgi:hypothetical protein